MTYPELKDLFCKHEADCPRIHLIAHIVFANFGPDNRKTYSQLERTYVVSSDNKAFQSGKSGYSIFGSCLDGTDQGVRLDLYMRDEHGGKNGWTVEDCYVIEPDEVGADE